MVRKVLTGRICIFTRDALEYTKIQVTMMEKTEALISWLSGQSLLSTGVRGSPVSEAHRWAPPEIESRIWQTGSGVFC